MLKIFSKRTLSLVLSVLMLMTLTPMVSAEDAAATTTDYENLVAGTTLHAYEDMTGETVQDSTGGTVFGFRAKSVNHHGFVTGGTDVRSETLPAVVAETEGSENSVLKFTGDDTANSYSAVSFRALYSGAGKYSGTVTSLSHTQAKPLNIQLWETRVKLPASTTGELRLFGYGEGYTGNVINSNQSSISIRNGGVYRVTDDFVPGNTTTYTENSNDIPYDVLLIKEGTLQADTWYTFVRVMDIRDYTCFYDRVFVFDAEGNLLEGLNDGWKKAGRRQANYAPDGTADFNMGLAFLTKGFKAGEDVYFDDVRIHKVANIPSCVVGTDTTGYTDMGAALYNDSEKMQYMGVTKYLRCSPINTYSVDVLLPSVGDETQQVELFSMSPITTAPDNAYFDAKYNALSVKGGQVYTSYYDTAKASKVETALTVGGNNVVLEAKKWYNFTYNTNIVEGTYTVTIKDIAADSVVATKEGTDGNKYTLDVNSEGKPAWVNTRTTILGAVGFDAPVLFDNISVDSHNADGSYVTASYQSQKVNFDAGAVGTAARLQIVTTPNISGLGSLIATDDKCVIFNKANALITGIPFATPAEVLPVTVAGVSAESFTAANIKLFDGETEVPDALKLDSATGTIDFEYLAAGKTYTLKLTNLESSVEPLNLLFTNQSLTIAIAEGVFTIKSLGLSGGVVALPATGDISGAVSISNATSDDQPIALILALYSDDEGLLDVAVWSDTVDAGDTTYAEATEALSVAGADYAKVMLWDGFQTLVPLTGDVLISPAA